MNHIEKLVSDEVILRCLENMLNNFLENKETPDTSKDIFTPEAEVKTKKDIKQQVKAIEKSGKRKARQIEETIAHVKDNKNSSSTRHYGRVCHFFVQKFK